MTPPRIFRVELVPSTTRNVQPCITLYTEADSASEAKAKVNRSHLRGRRHVAATTAIADGTGRDGIWWKVVA